MALKSVIIDDEFLARENLKMLLDEFCPEIDVIGSADSVETGLEVINEFKPEVVFLDIRMPSGAEGFELLEKVKDQNFMVVFVTAFKDYAVNAFNANAVHYVLKPVDIDDLKLAIKKLAHSKEQIDQNPQNLDTYLQTLENLSNTLTKNKPIQRITINHSKGFKIVNDSDIVHLDASGNCTMLHFGEGEGKYLDTRTLKIYEELLDSQKFFRIHKSHLINMTHLMEYLNQDGHFAVMKNGTRLPIARNRLKDFLAVSRNL